MSEQKQSSFMQELDTWTENTVLSPLAECANAAIDQELVDEVKKAIREKVLESYKNGLKAKPRSFPQPTKGNR